MDEELLREDVLRTIDLAVEELLSAAGVEEPPVDVLGLAQRHLGLSVAVEQTASNRKRAANQIVLTPGMSKEARHWTAARAIGHHLGAQLKQRLGEIGQGPLSRLFAEHLLLPACWFAADAPSCGFDVLELKKRYRTAPLETIAFRLLDLPAPCVITIADEDRVQRRRSNGPRVKKQLEIPETECLTYVSEHHEPHVLRRDGWTVQGWPGPLDGWNRVILRSAIETD